MKRVGLSLETYLLLSPIHLIRGCLYAYITLRKLTGNLCPEPVLLRPATDWLRMDFQLLIDALPTLLGAVIGAGVSIGTTVLSNHHDDKVEKRKRSEEYKRKMEERQIENYEKLQEAVIDYARANVVEYNQIRDLYASGVEYVNLRTDDEKGELLRLSHVRYSILCARVLSDDVRGLAKKFDDAVMNMTLLARDSKELETAFFAFGVATSELLDAIGVELRRLYASEALINSRNLKRAR